MQCRISGKPSDILQSDKNNPSKNSPPRNQRPGFNYQVLNMYQGTDVQAGVTPIQGHKAGISARTRPVSTLRVWSEKEFKACTSLNLHCSHFPQIPQARISQTLLHVEINGEAILKMQFLEFIPVPLYHGVGPGQNYYFFNHFLKLQLKFSIIFY